MLARVHGFNWEAYADHIMPAFTCWLVHGDAQMTYRLYEHTRCAYEEQFTPTLMQHLRTWPRAQEFVQQLPQGPTARREYQLLCDAWSFTAINDIYVHRHIPRLHQNTNALRVVWGSLIEHYCLPWFALPGADTTPVILNEKEATLADRGVSIGYHPAPIHLRGWLASVSVRAMALFEFLACGRRSMPFGYRTREPFEDVIGYLTPIEVLHLAQCLRMTKAPEALNAEQDYVRFRSKQNELSLNFRMIDEVLPAHAGPFLEIVRVAAQYGIGLICRIE